MDIPLFLSVPMIIFLGVSSIYYDIKTGKIPNKLISAGLAYAFSIITLTVLYLLLTGLDIRTSYIFDYILNIILAFIFSFVLWYCKIWSGGDAKLFLSFSALIPLSVYTNFYIYFFPSFAIIINTFLVVLVYLLINLFTQINKEKILLSVKNSLKKTLLLRFIVSVFSISWIVKVVMYNFFEIPQNIFLSLSAVTILYFVGEKYLKDKLLLFVIPLGISRMVFDSNFIFTFDFGIYMFYLLFVYIFFKVFILNLSMLTFSRRVNVSDLKKGMIPSEIIYKHNSEYKRMKIYKLVTKKRKPKPIINTNSLTEKDIALLKTLAKKRKIEPYLEINQMMPFAPFLSIGVMLTIIFGGVVHM